MSKPTIFVTSATGTQGLAVATLLSKTHNVISTTRTPTSPAARNLVSLGATVLEASWSSTAELQSALSGAAYLFLNLFPTFSDPSQESKTASTILQLARKAGIKHVVYSSVIPTHTLPGYDASSPSHPYREAKLQIEEIVKSSGIPWTIIHPGFLLANFIEGKIEFQFPRAKDTGVFRFLDGVGDVELPVTDELDVARFVKAILEQPERFVGETIEVVSQIVRFGEVIEGLGRVSGREIRREWIGESEVREEERFALGNMKMTVGFADLVDVERVKSWGVELGSLDGWLERRREDVEKTFAGAPVKKD
ncbi:hypothetical protein OQA88_2443 [Cercophora sp. LCS_1]